MIGSLQKRDITLFGLLAAISLAIGVAGWFVSEEFKEQMLQETAEDEALHMGFFVMERLSEPSATFAYGAITEQDQELINIVAETGNVYRYSFYNSDGIIVVASRPGDLGRRITDSFFFDVVRQGQTFVQFDQEVEFHPDDIEIDVGGVAGDREGRNAFTYGEERDSRTFVAEVYVPVIQDGAFLGAVEVYVDASGLSEYLVEEVEEARVGAGGMLLLLVVAFAFVVRGNIADRNRQLTTVRAASESLSMAEEEVLRLNADLEKRVNDRTSELGTANEAVTKLNEDLERRVEERTDQISKANDQLYRLNESMTRLNEGLEQRVEERTSALNKASADVQKLNQELERRVEERTTELHAAQADLLRNERLAALGQLTATVSHELRNPLGAIRTAVYLVAGRTQDKGLGVEGALERADRSITRCDNIITELLDFTRTTDLALESVPFDEWLSSVLDEQTVPKGIAFENRVSTQGLEIAFDQDRFRRVVINVFNNGCEAMLEEAQSGSDKQHQMTVSSNVRDDRLEIRFGDNGPGIPQDILEKIFEPLYSTKSFGVGLGLPTVRQIMRQHGGDIEMQSNGDGQGTMVLLWLPLSLGKSMADPADQAPQHDVPEHDAAQVAAHEAAQNANRAAVQSVASQAAAGAAVGDAAWDPDEPATPATPATENTGGAVGGAAGQAAAGYDAGMGDPSAGMETPRTADPAAGAAAAAMGNLTAGMEAPRPADPAAGAAAAAMDNLTARMETTRVANPAVGAAPAGLGDQSTARAADPMAGAAPAGIGDQSAGGMTPGAAAPAAPGTADPAAGRPAAEGAGPAAGRPVAEGADSAAGGTGDADSKNAAA